MAEGDEPKSLLARLGRHRMGKSCLYFKRLADLDVGVLEQLVAGSVAEGRRPLPCPSSKSYPRTHRCSSPIVQDDVRLA